MIDSEVAVGIMQEEIDTRVNSEQKAIVDFFHQYWNVRVKNETVEDMVYNILVCGVPLGLRLD